MNKAVLIPGMLLIIFAIAGYTFIPARISVAEVRKVNANQNAINRTMTNREKWQKWWKPSRSVQYNDSNFTFHNQLTNTVALTISIGNTVYPARITVASLRPDSSTIIADCYLGESKNPLDKINLYLASRKIKNLLAEILQNLAAFTEKQENIYGLTIRQAKVKDSTLVSTWRIQNHPPGTQDIYAMIDELKKFINAQGAKQTDPPMLHIDSLSESSYEIMVAIPVNRVLPATGTIQPKRMVLGNILVAEVQGGPAKIYEGMKELTHYVLDHRRTSPAIPFESLVTDRRREPDTTKWVTRLCFPIL